MSHEVRVAAVQLASGPDARENVERATVLVRRAALDGARYVQLPEYFNFRGPTLQYRTVAESVPGPTTDQLGSLARELGITLHVGSLFELCEEPDKSYNTSVVLSPSGDIAASYRKVHLFDVNVPGGVEHRESRNIAPGDQLVVADVEGFSLGMSVCFDVRFPELYRELCLAGATVLAVPSSFAVATGRVHWSTLLRARAIENEAYVIAAAQAGTTSDGISSYGHSMIIDPWGEVLAESTIDGEDVLVATIDLDEVPRRRAQIAVFELRRPDVYDRETLS
ncbi:MAG TPA: carbon-nitrogen hydrolase family protein [Acidimicrobiales bacterium]|jgi:predicted amidohydrolase|nr:carbon-nitrogen hydrolase family protein [Acidimicrobiales bacterium]